MKTMKSTAAICAVALAVQGCATASKDLTPTYISPLQYQSYDCEQIAAEVARIQARVVQLGGRLDQAANNDAGIMAVGLLLFWPVLFALGGTKQQEAEYSRLKGEYDALEQQAVLKKCQRAAPPPVVATPTQPSTSPIAAVEPVAAVPAAVPAEAVSSSPLIAVPAVQIVPMAATTPSSAAGAGQVSKHMFSAERLAKGSGCERPVATMNIRTVVSETFTVACFNGEALSIRCENGACRVLQ
jgi:hypothetical protein